MRAVMMIGAAFVMALQVTPAAAAVYHNARFGYTVVYPSNQLIEQPEPENGDGRAFVAQSGQVRFTVYASYRQDFETLSNLIEEAETTCSGTTPTYRVVKTDVVAMSCLHNKTIFYQKTMITGDRLTTLTASYPAQSNSVWAKVVTDMAASLKPAVR